MSENEPWSWDDNDDGSKPTQSDKVVDISFKLKCQCLHVDHTDGLALAIADALPWFNDEDLSALHLIHVAGSQNGWMRPEEPDELLYLSKRTRLMIRVPTHRIEDTHTLIGQSLDINGNAMEIGAATQKPVVPSDILFSRYVVAEDNDDENEFLRAAANELKQMNIRFKKLLPGKQTKLRAPEGEIATRSLMVADIDPTDSLILQERGIGQGRKHGCGIFIHHKGIKAVKPDDSEG